MPGLVLVAEVISNVNNDEQLTLCTASAIELFLPTC